MTASERLMKSLFDPTARDAILDRLDLLRPEAERRWGTMSIGRMLTHLADQLRYGVGERKATGTRGVLTIPLVQWLTIAVLPWPHGRIRASHHLLATEPGSFETDRASLRALIVQFSAIEGTPGEHPMFGPLSRPLWGHLALRHLDYHLRQFSA